MEKPLGKKLIHLFKNYTLLQTLLYSTLKHLILLPTVKSFVFFTQGNGAFLADY